MAIQNINLGKKGSFKVHKGALHRAIGVPSGQKIPASKLAAAANSQDPKTRRMAASAKGFKAMNHSHGAAASHSKPPGKFGGPPVGLDS